MNKADVQAWRRRWRLVNAFEKQELRATTVETKFRQLAAMMQTALVLNWETSTEAELKALRQRWIRLKRARHDAR